MLYNATSFIPRDFKVGDTVMISWGPDYDEKINKQAMYTYSKEDVEGAQVNNDKLIWLNSPFETGVDNPSSLKSGKLHIATLGKVYTQDQQKEMRILRRALPRFCNLGLFSLLPDKWRADSKVAAEYEYYEAVIDAKLNEPFNFFKRPLLHILFWLKLAFIFHLLAGGVSATTGIFGMHSYILEGIHDFTAGCNLGVAQALNSQFNDGICDAALNVPNCSFDGGDCYTTGTAPVANLTGCAAYFLPDDHWESSSPEGLVPVTVKVTSCETSGLFFVAVGALVIAFSVFSIVILADAYYKAGSCHDELLTYTYCGRVHQYLRLPAGDFIDIFCTFSAFALWGLVSDRRNCFLFYKNLNSGCPFDNVMESAEEMRENQFGDVVMALLFLTLDVFQDALEGTDKLCFSGGDQSEWWQLCKPIIVAIMFPPMVIYQAVCCKTPRVLYALFVGIIGSYVQCMWCLLCCKKCAPKDPRYDEFVEDCRQWGPEYGYSVESGDDTDHQQVELAMVPTEEEP